MPDTSSCQNPSSPPKRPSFAQWLGKVQQASLQSLLRMGAYADAISFAIGLPAIELFPIEEIIQSAAAELNTKPALLQYAEAPMRLKNHIAELMRLRGVQCETEQIFLTMGAQQGLSLLVHLLANPGGKIMVEETTYMGFLRILAPLQPEIITIPTDPETGIDVEAVEHNLRDGIRPAFLYLVADGHNPLGVSIDMAKRRRLAELARHYEFPILEDDPYGWLCYNREQALPPLRAFEDQWIYYVGSFSKILAPALRLGWIVVPKELIAPLTLVKESQDLDTATLAQYIAAGIFDRGDFATHLSRVRSTYIERSNAMQHALQTYLAPYAHWHKPAGGLFYWLTFTSAVDTTSLLEQAVETQHVSFMPGQWCFAYPDVHTNNCARLCFANHSPEHIEEGIRRLSHILQTLY